MDRGSGGGDRRQQQLCGGGGGTTPQQAAGSGPSYILDRHLLPRVQALSLVRFWRRVVWW